MFCKFCGKELSDDAKFCDLCGTAVEKTKSAPSDEASENDEELEKENLGEVEYAEEEEDEETEEETDEEAAEEGGISIPREYYDYDKNYGAYANRKKIKKGVAIAVTAIIAFIVAAAAGFVFCPFLRNLFTTTFLSSEKNVEIVVEEKVADLTDKVSNIACPEGGLDDSFVSGTQALKFNTDISLSSEGQSLLKELTGVDFSWAEKMGVDMSMTMQQNNYFIAFNITVNEKDFTNINVKFDADTSKCYLKCDLLGEDYYEIPLTEETSKLIPGTDTFKSSSSIFDFDISNASLSALSEALPDTESIIKILRRYVKVAATALKDVQKEKVTVKAGEIEQNMTKYSFVVNEEFVKNCFTAVLEEAKEDTEIYNIFKRIAEACDEEFYSTSGWKNELSNTIDKIKDTSYLFSANVSVYVNRRGELSGVSVESESVSFSAIYTKKDAEYTFQVKGDFSDNKFNVTIVGEEDKAGKKSGIVNAEYNGVTFKACDFEEVEFDSKNHISSGKILLNLEDYAGIIGKLDGDANISENLKGLSIKLVWSTTVNDSNAQIKLIKDKKELLLVDIGTSGAAPEMPTIADAKSQDEINIFAVIPKLLQKAKDIGVPDSLIDSLGSIE